MSDQKFTDAIDELIRKSSKRIIKQIFIDIANSFDNEIEIKDEQTKPAIINKPELTVKQKRKYTKKRIKVRDDRLNPVFRDNNSMRAKLYRYIKIKKCVTTAEILKKFKNTVKGTITGNMSNLRQHGYIVQVELGKYEIFNPSKHK